MSDTPPTPARPAASATADEMAHAEKLLGSTATAKEAAHDEPAAKGHGASKPAGGGTKKKKGKGKAGPSLGSRISGAIRSWRAQLVEIFRSLRSPDGPTRRMSVFFFLSLITLVFLSVLMVQRKIRLKHELEAQVVAAREEAVERGNEAALLGKSEVVSESTHALSLFNLGQFTIELRGAVGQPRVKGFMNMAEVEMVVECDSQETQNYIEENLVQARSQMTDIFLSMDRDELLSREGKRKLKKRLIERLNGWIPRGKVQNVFFSKLVVA